MNEHQGVHSELVSVIVPTRNSDSTLEECLGSIAEQTYRNFEILVVDRNSSDRTIKIAESYAEVFQCDSERSAARNFGAQCSQGSFLFFIDSDMVADKDLFQECVQLAKDGCQAVIIPEKTLGSSFLARVRELERSRNYGNTLYEAARFLTRNAFFGAGQYRAGLVGFEDFDLQSRLEKRALEIGRASKYLFHREDTVTLAEHLRKKRAYAKDARRYLGTEPQRALKQILPTKLIGALQDPDSWRKPHLLAGLWLLKTLEMIACAPEFLGRTGVELHS